MCESFVDILSENPNAFSTSSGDRYRISLSIYVPLCLPVFLFERVLDIYNIYPCVCVCVHFLFVGFTDASI